MARIQSFAALERELRELHDCEFDLDAAAYDPAASTWRGSFLRPMAGRQASRWRFLPWYRFDAPLESMTLTVRGVTACETRDGARIGRYTLEEIERTGSGLRLKFHEDLEIALEVPREIEAEVAEHGDSGRVTPTWVLLYWIEITRSSRPRRRPSAR